MAVLLVPVTSTDFAQQFSLSVLGPSHPVVVLFGWPEQAGAGFSDHIVPAAIAFDCEARYVLSYGDLVTARVMCPTGNNPEDS